MPELFTPLRLGSLEVRNRLVRSATGEGAADPDTGCPTPAMAAFYRRLAAGGVGLVITGHTAVRPEGRCHRGMTACTSAAFVPAFRGLVQACHAGGAAVVCQLNHGGRQVDTSHPGIVAVGPSREVFAGAVRRPQRELGQAEIEDLVKAFAQAAVWCREAGFDGVQIHAAHGYLISQFNSPLTNRRTDRWGGDPERRGAFLLAVYGAMRAALGPDYPILVKHNLQDLHPEGLTVAAAVALCRRLDAAGITAIEVSAGVAETVGTAFRHAELQARGERVLFAAECRCLRAAVTCPLILTGGIRTPGTAARLLRDGVCDAIGLCRPLIREPDLPRQWQAGALAPARCTSCGACRTSPDTLNVCALDA